MKTWILLLGISTVLSLVTLHGGNQNPAETPKAKKTLSPDNVEIAYTTYGSGKTTVIFIHGGFADQGYWKNQVKPFAKNYGVITVDLAGHGKSGKNREKWDIYAFARDVCAVMKKENVQQAVLVGNSLGGPVALETTRLMPNNVVGIVPVDNFQYLRAATPEADEYFKKQAQAYRSDFTGTMRKMVRHLFHEDVDPKLYAEIEKKMLNHSGEIAAAMLESFAGYDMAETAKKVPHPIRCINGDLMPTAIEKNREIHPDFDAVILTHTGHYPMLERPELFNRHLMEILEELEKPEK
jgi:pimeloyl-ACP methyl ester carboxylesterase